MALADNGSPALGIEPVTADPVLGWTKLAVEALPQRLPGLRGSVLLESIGHWPQQEARSR